MIKQGNTQTGHGGAVKSTKAGIYPSFNPGGQTAEPPTSPDAPLLFVQISSRYSIYLESDAQAEFIVNAAFSPYNGVPWGSVLAQNETDFVFSINLVLDDTPLVENRVTANTTENVFSFAFTDHTSLTPRLEPYEVVLYGAPEGGSPAESATTLLYYLPKKTNGSVTRIDNLSGGIYFRNAHTNSVFEPYFPYGYYASDDGFLSADNYTAQIDGYAGLGLSSMTPLAQYPKSQAALDYLNEIDLRWMEDLREDYSNLTWLTDKVTLAKDSDALWAYWLIDEPDGWQYSFNSTTSSASTIKSLDPYHPIAIVLNCQNYYFGPYSSPADIIMEDAYPIAINSTFSKWNTTCNTTIGDCGCDNCQGNVQDVSNRLHDLYQYEEWLGLWHKPKIHNPQTFHGEDYWFRDPSVEEEWAMVMLAVNHGAKGIIPWVWPASEELDDAHGELSKVLTTSPVMEFLVGVARPTRVEVEGQEVVDVAYWVMGAQMLVAVVNGGYVEANGVMFEVPGAIEVTSSLWGDVSWSLSGNVLSTMSMPAMGTSIVLLQMIAS